MRERATVVKAAGKIATVRIVKNPQCESCRACAFKNGKSTVNVKAKNEIGAAVGDSVTVAAKRITARSPLFWSISCPCSLRDWAF